MAPALHRLSEFFLLRDLEQRAREVPSDERAAVATAHERARQKRSAAEALWTAGSPAEALRLARDAVVLLRSLDGAEPPPADLPELDRDVKPEHADRYRALIAELDTLADAQLPRALDASAVRRLRISRIALGASVLVASLAAVWLLVRTPRVLKAEASARFDAAHEPQNAVDGNDKTEWLLPDRGLGWLDVQVLPPRKIARVKVMNARNPPWNDRATHEFHVEAFYKGQLVKQADGKFEHHSPEATWRTFDIGAKIDRVRLTVKSHHAQGAGFSEVEVE